MAFLFCAMSPQNALRPNHISALNPWLQNVPHSNKGSSKTCLLLVFPRKVPGTETVLFHLSNCAQPIYLSCLVLHLPLMLHLHPNHLTQLVCQFTPIPLSCEPSTSAACTLTRCALGLLFTLRLHSILLINNYLLGADNI